MRSSEAVARTGRPARFADRVMWRRDEDGGWRHRLGREYDGEYEGRTLWASYELASIDVRYTDVTVGVIGCSG